MTSINKDIMDETVDSDDALLPLIKVEDAEEDVKEKGLFRWIPCRYVVAIWTFLGFACAGSGRVCFNIALVAMVNTTENTDYNQNDTGDICPMNDTGVNTTINQGEFDWSNTTQNQLLNAFYYGYVVTQLPGGILADLFGCKIIFGSAVFFSTSQILLLPVLARTDVRLVLASRVLMGLLQGPMYPASYALWGKWAPELERTQLNTLAGSGLVFGTVLGYISTGYLCNSSFLGGWPSVFYVFGALVFIWIIPWILFMHNTPESHPRISKAELKLITSATGHSDMRQRRAPPWKAILTSKAVWAILLYSSFDGVAYYALINCVPLYLSRVLHFSLVMNGFISGLPQLGCFIVSFLGGFLADAIRRRGVSTRITRIIFTLSGCGSVVIAMIIITLADCNRDLVLTCLIVGVSLLGLQGSGSGVNPLDIAPMFAGSIVGLVNCVDNVGGFVAPTITEAITGYSSSRSEWRSFFYMAAGVYALAMVSFVLLVEGEVQEWAKPTAVIDHNNKDESSESDTGKLRDNTQKY